MERHETKETLAALERVRALLDQPRPGHVSETLGEAEVSEWERRHGVELPAEYRLYLKEIGNGGYIAGPNCDFIIARLAEEVVSVADTFPITRARERARLAEPLEGLLFPELERDVEVGEDRTYPGCLPLGCDGCGVPVFLVVTGELRGKVGYHRLYGACHTRDGELMYFLDWFESPRRGIRTPE